MEKVSEGKFTSYAWVILTITFIAGFASPANMMKMMVFGQQVMEGFKVDLSMLGLIIAIFYVLGVIVAIPSATIIKKLGIRIAVIISLGSGAVGSIVGAFSLTMGPDGVVLFLITRLLEGTGMGIMAITGAVAITPWFPKEKRGFPMGIWSMWVSLAAVICPLLYAHLVGSMSVPLDAVWFGTAAFDVIVLVIFLLLYRNPEHPFDDAEVSDTFGAQGTKHKFTDVFKSKAMIGMALIFLFDEFAFIGINQFLSPYLQSEAVGLDLGAASIFVTMFAVTGAAFSFIGGKLSDVFKTRRWLMLFGLICGGVFCVIVFNVTEAWLFWPLSILAGIVGAMAPTMIYAATPEAVPGDLVPEANSLIAMTQNLGMLAGSLVMGVAASAIGFAGTGIFIMMPMFIICIVIFFATTKSLR